MGKTGSAQLYDNEDDDDDYNGLTIIIMLITSNGLSGSRKKSFIDG